METWLMTPKLETWVLTKFIIFGVSENLTLVTCNSSFQADAHLM